MRWDDKRLMAASEREMSVHMHWLLSTVNAGTNVLVTLNLPRNRMLRATPYGNRSITLRDDKITTHVASCNVVP